MQFRPPSLLRSLGLLILIGCGREGAPDHPLSQGDWLPGDGTRDGTSTSGAGSGASLDGLPCDVAGVLQKYCVACHGATLAGGATVHLNSADALRTARDGSTVAELSLERMRSTTSPMPPVGARVSEAEIALLDAWVQDGMPDGSCSTIAVDDPFAAEPTCSTGKFWTGGDKGSPLMHPGKACIDCHQRGVRGERGPPFALAGTVFESGHEPDDCNGVNGKVETATVEITDANGRVTRLSVNAAGNFYLEGLSLRTPYTAKVSYQGRTRSMATPQTSGDCNSCHTQSGAEGAPGRIALP